MKIKSFILICCLIAYASLHAQRECNYLYYFDATQSMKTQVDIWEPTKQWLFDDVNRLTDGTVTIVPFQDKLYASTTFDAGELTAKQLAHILDNTDKQLDNIIKKRTNTNICDAWTDAMKRVDSRRDNYIYIITDGIDNVNGPEKLSRMIADWCSGKPDNVHVFYVMLTRYAYDKKLIEAINACPDIYLINAQGRHLPPFGAFSPREITVNTQDFRPRRLPFSAAGHYNLRATTQDPLFEVSVSPIDSGSAVFTIRPRNREMMEQQLQGRDEYSFDVNLSTDTQKLKIATDRIRVHVINKLERILYIQPSSTKLTSKIKHYRSFLFWKANRPDTFQLDLHELMNAEAGQRDATVTLQLTPDDEKLPSRDYQLFLNGKACPGNRMVLDKTTQDSRIGVVFSDEAVKAKHHFVLERVSHRNLDRINESAPEQFTMAFSARYKTRWNPLAVILTVLGCLIAAFLLLWFLIIKPSKYPKFKVSYLLMTGDTYQNIRLRNARELRFTNGSKRQGFLNRLFTGLIIFKTNPFGNAPDWRVTPRNRKKTKGCRISATGYQLNPTAALTLHGEDQTEISFRDSDGNGKKQSVNLQIQ